MAESSAPSDRPVTTGSQQFLGSSGMARKVDDLGRIVLPVEMRRMFGIQPGDELQIAVDGACILLHKPQPGCVFCDGIDGLDTYRGKPVCRSCARGLVGIDQVAGGSESPVSESPVSEPKGDLVDPPLRDMELGGNGR